MVGVIVELHLHQHVARKELPLRRDLAAAAHLHDLLHRHEHLFELIGEACRRGTLLDRLGDLPLEVRIGVHDVPAHCHLTRTGLLPADTQHEAHEKAQHLIGGEEEQRSRDHITSTMMVVITVSLRVGQVTLETSVRTCCRNSNGFVLAISFLVRSNCNRCAGLASCDNAGRSGGTRTPNPRFWRPVL